MGNHMLPRNMANEGVEAPISRDQCLERVYEHFPRCKAKPIYMVRSSIVGFYESLEKISRN